MTSRRAGGLSLILLGLATAAAGWGGYTWGWLEGRADLRPYLSDAAEELGALQAKYPGSFNSERGEEWILRDFFQEQRNGVFVDVGANHYRDFSNTYYLETALGWSGIAIEPQRAFAPEYAQFRPKTTFVPLFVSDVSDESAVLYVPENHLVASADRAFAEQRGGAAVAVQAQTTTLDDVLARLGIEQIDFLTMDIELSEPAALKGFSITRFRPALVCIEAHLAVRQEILDYFTRNGYVVLGQYLRADGRNLWFAPLETTPLEAGDPGRLGEVSPGEVQ